MATNARATGRRALERSHLPGPGNLDGTVRPGGRTRCGKSGFRVSWREGALWRAARSL